MPRSTPIPSNQSPETKHEGGETHNHRTSKEIAGRAPSRGDDVWVPHLRGDDESFLLAYSEVSQTQHIRHRIKPRLLAARPQRGPERAAREDHAVLGLVDELEAFGRSGKNY